MPERKLKVKSQKSKVKGFTLVELLVVISIIAILSTIGIVSFTRVSQIARDGKRVADIDSIAKSLETAKDFTTGIYYNKLDVDFPDGLPDDPVVQIDHNHSYHGCFSEEKQILGDPTNWRDKMWPQGGGPCYFQWLPLNGLRSDSFEGLFGFNVRSWKICAKKESDNTIYCKHSFER